MSESRFLHRIKSDRVFLPTAGFLSRGYYRCSTAKGCSAKKQVERCQSDASVLIITYTSSHNHPEGICSVSRIPKRTRQQRRPPDSRDQKKQEQEPSARDQEAQDPHRPTMEPGEFHYSQDLPVGELFTVSQLDTTGNNGSLGPVLLEEQPMHALPLESGSNNSNSELAPTARPTEPEVEEDEYYDFFDELEELHPTISCLLSYGLQEGHHRHHQLVRWRDSSCLIQFLAFFSWF